MTLIRSYLILFIINLQTDSFLDATGVIETNFIKFRNLEGKRFDGKCCDKGSWWFFDSDDCSEDCDHSFVVCLGNKSQSSSMTSCEFGRQETGAIGGNKIKFEENIGPAPNPLKFPFNKWPGLMKLKIDVIDEDDGDEYDFVDHFEYQYSTRDLRREIDTAPKSLILKGSRTRFDLQLKVFCDAGYYGSECSVYCRESDDDTAGHFNCDPGTGEKICKLGWEGPDCLQNIDDCVSHRCYSGATCVDGVSSYKCVCPPGRTGFTCEAEVNECASSPCQNGGKCQDAANSFFCQCQTGFVGPLCEINFDECISGPCMNGGLCQDGIASVTCLCQEGFSGDLCQLDENECETNPCVQAEKCIDLIADYKCECFPGYSGKNCDYNINECASTPCQNDGRCLDDVGSYMCVCEYGYTGSDCELPIDFCDPNHCLNGATCHNQKERFVCECPQGLTGNRCESDVDECAVDSCGHGRCINTFRGFKCECDIGYAGSLCKEEINECLVQENPCKNFGTCVDLIGKFRCSCLEGFTGSLCEVNIDECENVMCENNGTCIDLINEYRCECPETYTGSLCETEISYEETDILKGSTISFTKIPISETVTVKGMLLSTSSLLSTKNFEAHTDKSSASPSDETSLDSPEVYSGRKGSIPQSGMFLITDTTSETDSTMNTAIQFNVSVPDDDYVKPQDETLDLPQDGGLGNVETYLIFQNNFTSQLTGDHAVRSDNKTFASSADTAVTTGHAPVTEYLNASTYETDSTETSLKEKVTFETGEKKHTVLPVFSSVMNASSPSQTRGQAILPPPPPTIISPPSFYTHKHSTGSEISSTYTTETISMSSTSLPKLPTSSISFITESASAPTLSLFRSLVSSKATPATTKSTNPPSTVPNTSTYIPSDIDAGTPSSSTTVFVDTKFQTLDPSISLSKLSFTEPVSKHSKTTFLDNMKTQSILTSFLSSPSEPAFTSQFKAATLSSPTDIATNVSDRSQVKRLTSTLEHTTMQTAIQSNVSVPDDDYVKPQDETLDLRQNGGLGNVETYLIFQNNFTSQLTGDHAVRSDNKTFASSADTAVITGHAPVTEYLNASTYGTDSTETSLKENVTFETGEKKHTVLPVFSSVMNAPSPSQTRGQTTLPPPPPMITSPPSFYTHKHTTGSEISSTNTTETISMSSTSLPKLPTSSISFTTKSASAPTLSLFRSLVSSKATPATTKSTNPPSTVPNTSTYIPSDIDAGTPSSSTTVFVDTKFQTLNPSISLSNLSFNEPVSEHSKQTFLDNMKTQSIITSFLSSPSEPAFTSQIKAATLSSPTDIATNVSDRSQVKRLTSTLEHTTMQTAIQSNVSVPDDDYVKPQDETLDLRQDGGLGNVETYLIFQNNFTSQLTGDHAVRSDNKTFVSSADTAVITGHAPVTEYLNASTYGTDSTETSLKENVTFETGEKKHTVLLVFSSVMNAPSQSQPGDQATLPPSPPMITSPPSSYTHKHSTGSEISSTNTTETILMSSTSLPKIPTSSLSFSTETAFAPTLTLFRSLVPSTSTPATTKPPGTVPNTSTYITSAIDAGTPSPSTTVFVDTKTETRDPSISSSNLSFTEPVSEQSKGALLDNIKKQFSTTTFSISKPAFKSQFQSTTISSPTDITTNVSDHSLVKIFTATLEQTTKHTVLNFKIPISDVDGYSKPQVESLPLPEDSELGSGGPYLISHDNISIFPGNYSVQSDNRTVDSSGDTSLIVDHAYQMLTSADDIFIGDATEFLASSGDTSLTVDHANHTFSSGDDISSGDATDFLAAFDITTPPSVEGFVSSGDVMVTADLESEPESSSGNISGDVTISSVHVPMISETESQKSPEEKIITRKHDKAVLNDDVTQAPDSSEYDYDLFRVDQDVSSGDVALIKDTETETQFAPGKDLTTTEYEQIVSSGDEKLITEIMLETPSYSGERFTQFGDEHTVSSGDGNEITYIALDSDKSLLFTTASITSSSEIQSEMKLIEKEGFILYQKVSTKPTLEMDISTVPAGKLFSLKPDQAEDPSYQSSSEYTTISIYSIKGEDPGRDIFDVSGNISPDYAVILSQDTSDFTTMSTPWGTDFSSGDGLIDDDVISSGDILLGDKVTSSGDVMPTDGLISTRDNLPDYTVISTGDMVVNESVVFPRDIIPEGTVLPSEDKLLAVDISGDHMPTDTIVISGDILPKGTDVSFGEILSEDTNVSSSDTPPEETIVSSGELLGAVTIISPRDSLPEDTTVSSGDTFLPGTVDSSANVLTDDTTVFMREIPPEEISTIYIRTTEKTITSGTTAGDILDSSEDVWTGVEQENDQVWIKINGSVTGDSKASFINYTEYRIVSLSEEDDLPLSEGMKIHSDDIIMKTEKRDAFGLDDTSTTESKISGDTTVLNELPLLTTVEDFQTTEQSHHYVQYRGTTNSEKLSEGSGEYYLSEGPVSGKVTEINYFKNTITGLSPDTSFRETLKRNIPDITSAQITMSYDTKSDLKLKDTMSSDKHIFLSHTSPISRKQINKEGNQDLISTEASTIAESTNVTMMEKKTSTKLSTRSHDFIHISTTTKPLREMLQRTTTTKIQKIGLRPVNPWLLASRHLQKIKSKIQAKTDDSVQWGDFQIETHFTKLQELKTGSNDEKRVTKTPLSLTMETTTLAPINDSLTFRQGERTVSLDDAESTSETFSSDSQTAAGRFTSSKTATPTTVQQDKKDPPKIPVSHSTHFPKTNPQSASSTRLLNQSEKELNVTEFTTPTIIIKDAKSRSEIIDQSEEPQVVTTSSFLDRIHLETERTEQITTYLEASNDTLDSRKTGFRDVSIKAFSKKLPGQIAEPQDITTPSFVDTIRSQQQTAEPVIEYLDASTYVTDTKDTSLKENITSEAVGKDTFLPVFSTVMNASSLLQTRVTQTSLPSVISSMPPYSIQEHSTGSEVSDTHINFLSQKDNISTSLIPKAPVLSQFLSNTKMSISSAFLSEPTSTNSQKSLNITASELWTSTTLIANIFKGHICKQEVKWNRLKICERLKEDIITFMPDADDLILSRVPEMNLSTPLEMPTKASYIEASDERNMSTGFTPAVPILELSPPTATDTPTSSKTNSTPSFMTTRRFLATSETVSNDSIVLSSLLSTASQTIPTSMTSVPITQMSLPLVSTEPASASTISTSGPFVPPVIIPATTKSRYTPSNLVTVTTISPWTSKSMSRVSKLSISLFPKLTSVKISKSIVKDAVSKCIKFQYFGRFKICILKKKSSVKSSGSSLINASFTSLATKSESSETVPKTLSFSSVSTIATPASSNSPTLPLTTTPSSPLTSPNTSTYTSFVSSATTPVTPVSFQSIAPSVHIGHISYRPFTFKPAISRFSSSESVEKMLVASNITSSKTSVSTKEILTSQISRLKQTTSTFSKSAASTSAAHWALSSETPSVTQTTSNSAMMTTSTVSISDLLTQSTSIPIKSISTSSASAAIAPDSSEAFVSISSPTKLFTLNVPGSMSSGISTSIKTSSTNKNVPSTTNELTSFAIIQPSISSTSETKLTKYRTAALKEHTNELITSTVTMSNTPATSSMISGIKPSTSRAITSTTSATQPTTPTSTVPTASANIIPTIYQNSKSATLVTTQATISETKTYMSRATASTTSATEPSTAAATESTSSAIIPPTSSTISETKSDIPKATVSTSSATEQTTIPANATTLVTTPMTSEIKLATSRDTASTSATKPITSSSIESVSSATVPTTYTEPVSKIRPIYSAESSSTQTMSASKLSITFAAATTTLTVTPLVPSAPVPLTSSETSPASSTSFSTVTLQATPLINISAPHTSIPSRYSPSATSATANQTFSSITNATMAKSTRKNIIYIPQFFFKDNFTSMSDHSKRLPFTYKPLPQNSTQISIFQPVKQSTVSEKQQTLLSSEIAKMTKVTRPTPQPDQSTPLQIPSTTRKLSVIRHRMDLASGNVYPNPRKEVSEYIQNTTIVRKKAVLTFKMIRVTVVKTVSQAFETGRRVVLQSYHRVKHIATTVTVTTYNRAKLLLQQALQRVGALWQYCKTGINHFIVKPLLNARVYVKHKFEQAYVRLGQLFERGKQILDTTIDTFKEETSTYFENLANYYSGVYRQYTNEVKDIFESLKIPDNS